MKNNDEVLSIIYNICNDTKYEVGKYGIVTIFEKQDHKVQRFFRKLKFKIPMYKKLPWINIVVLYLYKFMEIKLLRE